MRRNTGLAVRPAVFFLLCLCMRPVRAELKVISTEFSPSGFTVGMRVQVYTRVELVSGILPEGTIVPEPAAAAELAPSIYKINLKKEAGYYLYTVVFTPWEEGKGIVPAVLAGTEILPPIPFVTSTALAEDSSLPLPRAQKEPQGMRIRIYLFIGALLLLLFSCVFSVLALPRLLAGFWERLALRRAKIMVLGILSELEKSADSGTGSWLRLCSALRVYLGFRLAGTDFFSRGFPSLPALTAREFSRLPPESIPGGGFDAVAGILLRGDLVRWAGNLDSRLPEAVHDAREAVAALEAALSAPKAAPSGKAAGRDVP